MNRLSLWGRGVLRPIDSFLDRLTSYRLVTYTLLIYAGWALVGSLAGKVPFHWYLIVLSAAGLAAVCWLSNWALSRFFNIPRNSESYLITALILSLILTPPKSLNDGLILAAAGVVAMVSKYILTFKRWHLFNPAALGAFIAGALFHRYASWWIGTAFLMPVVLAGGLLILRKMQRFWLAVFFTVVALAIINWNGWLNQPLVTNWHHIWLILASTQIIFFASIMLPEPLTSPRQTTNYLLYGLLVAVLYGFTRLRISPEQALLLGNIFAYLIEPQSRQVVAFVNKHIEAADVQSFRFKPKVKIKYQAGQYMEWTVATSKGDSRGNRRYLTLSSSPTEDNLMVSVRMPDPASSFKRKLSGLQAGEAILAAQVSGEFTLPKSPQQKLAFIAGGIGVTPFRSMVKYLVDSQQTRPIRMLYAANSAEEFAFSSLFSEAKRVGLETFYLVTGNGRTINETVIRKAVPDYAERIFYVSGPYGFVRSVKDSLLKMDVPPKKIVSDYFPGYG